MMTGRNESNNPPTTRRVRNFDPQDAQPPFSEKFQEIAGQNEGQGHEQQKYQNGESGEEQERKALLIGVRVEKRQIEGRLGKENPKQQQRPDGQQDDDFLAAGRFLIAGWTGSSHCECPDVSDFII